MATKVKRKRSSILRIRGKNLSVSAPNSDLEGLTHDKDFYKWTNEQVKFLKKKEFNKLDISHLIEELESLGNSEKRALESHLIILFLHLLKIDHQPTMRCKSWENSVENARFRINKLIKENPSLKRKLADFLPDAYFSARLEASSETGLDVEEFPTECPWNIKDIL